MEEIWKDIPGYEGFYKISSIGIVIGLERYGNMPANNGLKIIKGRQIKGYICNHGYKEITLSKNGKREKFLLHRLLGMLFFPNPENKRTINHKDGNKLNNDLKNLEWATDSENLFHAYRLGLKKVTEDMKEKIRGENNNKAKLSVKDIIDIRAKLAYGMRQIDIAKFYNITQGTVSDINREKTWMHLTKTTVTE